MIIEGSNSPIAEMGGGAAATEVDHAVARQIVAQIPDGACLQLGIGGMPNAVGSLIAESDLKDLGVHTEMYVDGFVDMALAGVRYTLLLPAQRNCMTIWITIRNV